MFPASTVSGRATRRMPGAERGGRGLPLRAGDPDDGSRAGAKEERHLHLDPGAGGAGTLEPGGIERHGGIADHEVGPLEVLGAVLAQHIANGQAGQLLQCRSEVRLRAEIGHGDLGALRHQVAGHADAPLARAQAHHQRPRPAQILLCPGPSHRRPP